MMTRLLHTTKRRNHYELPLNVPFARKQFIVKPLKPHIQRILPAWWTRKKLRIFFSTNIKVRKRLVEKIMKGGKQEREHNSSENFLRWKFTTLFMLSFPVVSHFTSVSGTEQWKCFREKRCCSGAFIPPKLLSSKSFLAVSPKLAHKRAYSNLNIFSFSSFMLLYYFDKLRDKIFSPPHLNGRAFTAWRGVGQITSNINKV